MKKVSRMISIIIVAIIMLSTVSFAAELVYPKEEVSIEQASDKVVTLNFNEGKGTITKQIDKVDTTNKKVYMHIDAKNNQKEETKTIENKIPSEIMLVIDNSDSMKSPINQAGKTRTQAVNEAAKALIDRLFEMKNDIKIGIVSFSYRNDEWLSEGGSIEDAKLQQALTTNKETLKTALDNIQYTGAWTNIESGLKRAENNFTSEDNNKCLILLSDGIPNVSIGYDKIRYNTTTRNATKAALNEVVTKGHNLITVLTGVNSSHVPPETSQDGAALTFGVMAEDIFGTQETPKYGTYYYISDDSIITTISERLLENVVEKETVTIKHPINNIVVTDFIPEDIRNNFSFALDEEKTPNPTKGTFAESYETDGKITWTIGTLDDEEKESLYYVLTLKDNVKGSAIDKILNTNQKLVVDYDKDDGTPNKEETTETPAVKLTTTPAPTPTPKPTPTPDNTVAKDDIPKTGEGYMIFGLISIVIVAGIVIYKKYKISEDIL